MNLHNSISFGAIIRTSPVKILLTWTMVILENILLILLPLFIGYAIDGVLEQSLTPLIWFACVFPGSRQYAQALLRYSRIWRTEGETG
ncbi:ABC transporter six-transmembrane domain-containing protein [Pseudoalteromonas rubra]|uniref:ABC transporter six-transmembrane domain-containing protein n=1 Tax=Pseudoalteromonas rubra TaxID=43658 RepID=UPI002692419E